MVCEITTLGHESVDDSMEVRTGVSVSLFVVSDTNRPEVLGCLWHFVFIELKCHSSDWLTIVVNIEVNSWVLWIAVVASERAK